MDGNGRMGRLWQTVILMSEYGIFEFLPFETVIKQRQQEYYKTLELCDKEGKSTKFISFMLSAIDNSLQQLLQVQPKVYTSEERIEYFILKFTGKNFSRKE
jgi:Fic family protein